MIHQERGKMSQTWQHTMSLCPHVSHRTMNAREVTKIGYQLFKENPIETHYGLVFGVLGYENFLQRLVRNGGCTCRCYTTEPYLFEVGWGLRGFVSLSMPTD